MGIGVLGELWRCPVLHEARDNEKNIAFLFDL